MEDTTAESVVRLWEGGVTGWDVVVAIVAVVGFVVVVVVVVNEQRRAAVASLHRLLQLSLNFLNSFSRSDML